MKTHLSWLCIAVFVFTGPRHLLHGEEVVFHTGPSVSTPASTPVSPLPQNGEPKLIQFQREFFADGDLLTSLPEPSSNYGTVPLSAVEAINITTKDIDPQGELRSLIVTELRLLRGPANASRQFEYYLVSTLANGSEEHRVVLMNRSVISPRLRKITE